MPSSHERDGIKLPRLQHVSLSIKSGSQDQIRAFYSGLLGFQEKQAPASLAARGVVWFAAGVGEIELHFVPDSYLQRSEEARHFCLEVSDVEAYRNALKEAGYQIIEAEPILHRPRFFTIDPCGNHLEITTILGDYTEA
ncbi:glyoxalase [Dictyobacter sp. S3.2.2.5]|uniref:Glyoxalase n=1 Tax=Dictyobacter halimunensis TaxID=3026934 RepID=A0ABQ6FTX8_9CHLR|nr:glyoxalase [Dictyobacter sp. S3.2.2.5]